MPFTVYILYSASLDKYYIGFTSEHIDERIRKHSSNHGGFTTRAKDWKLVYSEIYSDKASAMKREKEIKAWKSKKRIEALISQQ